MKKLIFLLFMGFILLGFAAAEDNSIVLEKYIFEMLISGINDSAVIAYPETVSVAVSFYAISVIDVENHETKLEKISWNRFYHPPRNLEVEKPIFLNQYFLFGGYA